jgi:Ca2+/H+ antiporter
MLMFVVLYDEVQLVMMFVQYLLMNLIMHQVNFQIMSIEDLIKDNPMAKERKKNNNNKELNRIKLHLVLVVQVFLVKML